MEIYLNFYDQVRDQYNPNPENTPSQADAQDLLYVAVSTSGHAHYCQMNLQQYLEASGGPLGAISPQDRLNYLLRGIGMRATPALTAFANQMQMLWTHAPRRPQLPATESINLVTQNLSGHYPNYYGSFCSGITDGLRMLYTSPIQNPPSPTPPRHPRMRTPTNPSTRTNPTLIERIPPGTSDTGTYEITDGGVRRVE